ncbi:MAG: hypothetical protein K0R02_752 [Rickettsiaceae bacterium]|jgi:hypothetical protein|nr:hypothetical protein [Rickettsiaceae bacterium]
MSKVIENDFENLLSKIETESNFSILDYLNNKSKKYPQAICMGKKNIPTPKMLHKIITVNKELIKSYPVIEAGLRLLMQSSNNFYESLIKLMQKNVNEKTNFEYEFDKFVQPYGQIFVNNLKALKYRLDELRIDNAKLFLKTSKKTQEDFAERNIRFKKIRKMVLHMKKVLAFYPQTSYKAYIITTIISVIFAGIGGFTLAESITDHERASFAASYASLTVLILFMASFTIQLFEYTDISGRNVLAWNYKTLFNSALYKAKHENN